MATALKVGEIVEAEVAKITDFGAFVKIYGRGTGLIHISQISDDFVKEVSEHLKVGDRVRARVIKLGPGKKIDLTMKGLRADSQRAKSGPACRQAGFKSSDFEEKLERFLQTS